MTMMLEPRHAKHLAEFRISPEILKANGIRSVSDAAGRELLGVNGYRSDDFSGILFPSYDPFSGARNGARIRLDRPISLTNGEMKYVSEQGNVHLFLPRPLRQEWLGNVAIPICIVEAEKSALALKSLSERIGEEMIPIAVGGCWGWKRKNGTEVLPDGSTRNTTGPSPDFGLFDWNGRPTVVLYDSNIETKFEVQMAAVQLSKHLASLGAKVYRAQVPVLPGVNGPDDFIKQSTDAEVCERMLWKVEPYRPAEKEERKKKPSQAEEIVNDVVDAGLRLFHASDATPYASLEMNGHTEILPLRSRTFKNYVAFLTYERRQRVTNANGLANALAVLEAKALFEGEENEVHTRAAEHEGALWLDLANKQWQAVRITAAGWEIVDNPPVWFRRSPGMLPLPTPQRGGEIAELFKFLNLRSANDQILVATWLLAALRPKGPYPILNFFGEHGSAKSTATRVLRALVDPYKAPVRSLPKDERDLQISARSSHVQAFDNVSALSREMADALCRLATGGGSATRALYTDFDECIFDAQRPVVVNGIEDLGTRGDFADRSVMACLERLEHVRDEKEFWSAFAKALGRILGSLLDAMVVGLGKVDTVEISHPPRMADFAKLGVAVEEALGFKPGTFLAAYNQNRQDVSQSALEASPIPAPLRAFIEQQPEGKWTGTNAELLVELRRKIGDEAARSASFPKTPRALSGTLRRLAPNLRNDGIEILFNPRTGRERPVSVKVAGRPS